MWCYKFLFAALVGLALSAGENQTSTTASAATPETSTNTFSNSISFVTTSQIARTTAHSSDSMPQELDITVANNTITNGSRATSTVTESTTFNESTFSVNNTTSPAAPVAGTTDISTSSVTASNSSTSVPAISVPLVNPCEAGNPCDNGGTCSFNGSVVVCTCTVEWTGYNCTTDFDECVNSTHKCNTNNSVCNNVDGDYTCSCNPGYARGEHNKHCVDFNECASTTHNCTNLEKCVNTVGSFQCECGGDNFYNETVGTCQKMKIEKVEYRIPGNSTVNLDDKTSDSYKNLIKEIERNMTELLIRDNSGGIHRVKVIDLRKGSIIVTAVVQLNTTKALDLPTDYSLMPKQDDDYCLWNQCDLKSTNCRGSANLEDYSCECKDDSFERVEGAYYWCRYKDECRPVTNNCSAPGKECLMQDGIYKCLPSREVSKSDCDDPIYCHNSGTCIQSSDTGKAHCSCADGYMGANCEIKSVKASEVTDLRNILIGVGVGLGSLALFCSIALIIVCCSDRSKSSKATLTSRHYVGDDVTIDTWEPSLPRPKIKPGAFSHSSMDRMEMDERRPHSEREQGAGAENPAFIPEADYESSGRRGRGAPNGKKGASEFVYF